MNRYVTVAELKDYLRDELAASNDDFIEEAINAGESFLDERCQRRFEVAAASASARRYAGSARELLRIHDCVSITTVVENGVTLVADTDYQVEPFDNLDAAGATVPYEQLARLDATWYADGRKPTVTVTARWGWAAIPPMIIGACKVAAKAYLQSRDVSLGLAAIADSGGVGEREAKLVRDAINAHRRVESFGIA